MVKVCKNNFLIKPVVYVLKTETSYILNGKAVLVSEIKYCAVNNVIYIKHATGAKSLHLSKTNKKQQH